MTHRLGRHQPTSPREKTWGMLAPSMCEYCPTCSRHPVVRACTESVPSDEDFCGTRGLVRATASRGFVYSGICYFAEPQIINTRGIPVTRPFTPNSYPRPTAILTQCCPHPKAHPKGFATPRLSPPQGSPRPTAILAPILAPRLSPPQCYPHPKAFPTSRITRPNSYPRPRAIPTPPPGGGSPQGFPHPKAFPTPRLTMPNRYPRPRSIPQQCYLHRKAPTPPPNAIPTPRLTPMLFPSQSFPYCKALRAQQLSSLYGYPHHNAIPTLRLSRCAAQRPLSKHDMLRVATAGQAAPLRRCVT